MSKIGRKPIAFSAAKIEILGNDVTISGSKANFVHQLPDCLTAEIDGKNLKISMKEISRDSKMLWGLHRALLANKVKGAETGFEQKMTIVGLGYKAQLSGSKAIFSLGYTHKIEYDLPKEVTLEVDKSGQVLLFKSSDKFILGNVCDTVRSFRPPEPYKGTGIIREGEVILRKAGKTKSS